MFLIRLITFISVLQILNPHYLYSIDFLSALAQQSLGQIVAVNGSSDSNVIEVAQYTTAGQINTTFGINGIASVSVGSTAGGTSIAVSPNDDSIFAGGLAVIAGGTHALVVKFDANGVIDNTFGENGIATELIEDAAQVNGVSVQEDNKIVVCGTSVGGGSPHLFVARFNTDGTLDTTFNTTGIVIESGLTSSRGEALLVQPVDQRIVVVGSTQNADFTLIRYNTNGSRDTTFNTTGLVQTPLANPAGALGIDIDNNSKLLVCGASNSQGIIARYNTDGSVDTPFATNGFFTLPGPEFSQFADVMFKPTNKIYAVGLRSINSLIIRLSTGGSLDQSFNSGGIAEFALGDESQLLSGDIDADEKPLACGFTDEQGMIIRVTRAGNLDGSFGSQGIAFFPPEVFSVTQNEVLFTARDFFPRNSLINASLDRFTNLLTFPTVMGDVRLWNLQTEGTNTAEAPYYVQFKVPQDYVVGQDNTEVDIHIFTKDEVATTTGEIRVRILPVFATHNTQIDSTTTITPQDSEDVILTEAGTTGNALRHFVATVALPSTEISPGAWAYMGVTLIDPLDGVRYSGTILLSGASFRYSKLNV